MEQTLELTYPRVVCLMNAMGTYPPISVTVSELLKAIAKSKDGGVGKMQSVMSGLDDSGGSMRKVTPGEIGRKLKNMVGA